jgi:FixJ family two-component response regulator
LVVEDDHIMCEAIERLLTHSRFWAAYASADALPPQDADADSACVISDLRLPRMSGFGPLALFDR